MLLFNMIELELNDELKANLIDYMFSKGYSIGTMKVYKSHITKLFDSYKTLNKKNALLILKKFQRPYHRAILSLINEYCFYNEIDFNLKLPRQMKKPRPIPHTLTLEEIEMMIKVTPKPYDLFLRTIFGFGSGLRISEVIRLSWQRFNWYHWLQHRDENGIYEIIATKRGKNFYVTVPKILMEEYYKYARELENLNEFGVPKDGVIYNFGVNNWRQDLKEQHLELWKHSYVKMAYDFIRYNILIKYCNKAIGKKIHIHWLRHSRATYLLEQGINIEEISKLLGHTDIRTSLIYANVSMKKVKKSMENISTI